MRLPRLAIAVGLFLALTSCAGLGALMGAGVPAPAAVQTASAPLARTTIDETAVRALYQSLDTVRAGVDGLVASGVLVRNSPAALRVRAGLIAARDSINAAADLVALLNDPLTTLSAETITTRLTEYRDTIRRASAAFEEIAAAIRER